MALYGFQTGRIFCANFPSQKARGASYNLLLLLRKDCLFCHRSECYGPPSPSISLESIKSQELFKLLRKAYVDARYKPSYTITEDQLEWLAGRVTQLKELTETLCREKIDSFS